MNTGDPVVVRGRTAIVVAVRKHAPVAVVEFENGERDLLWFGPEPSTPTESLRRGPSGSLAEVPHHSPSVASRQPETPAQAAAWTVAKARYTRAGLCPRCAAQGAWGHQLGFSNVKPPCDQCQPIVATFPQRASASWSKLTQHTAAEYTPSRSET